MSPRSDSAAAHATAAADKRDAHLETGGHERDPANVTRSLHPIQAEPLGSGTETRTACSPKQAEVWEGCKHVETEDGKLLTSRRATRSDTQTLITASPSCSASV